MEGLIKIKIVRIFLLLWVNGYVANSAWGSLYFQYSVNYHTDTDTVDAEPFEYSKMNNMIFVGAAIGSAKKFHLGQNFMSWSKSHKKGTAGTTSDLSLTEMGPRFVWFLNDAKNWAVAFAWHPYVKGSRTIAGASSDISGSSMLGTFAYQYKLSKSFYMGASINYHAVSISESVVDNTQADVSHTYVSIMPMLEMSIRFK